MVGTIITIFLLIEAIFVIYISLDKRIKELEKSVQELKIEANDDEEKFKKFKTPEGLFTNKRK